MKIKVLLIVFLVLLSQGIFAQYSNLGPKEVEDFWNDVDRNGMYNKKMEFSKNEIKEIAIKLFKAVNVSPREFVNSITKRNLKIKQEEKSKNRKLQSAGVQLGNVMRQISKHFGENFAQTIRNPYYFRFLAQKQIDTIYFSKDENRSFECKKITGIIEDIVKGENTLKNGDYVELIYLPTWFEETLPANIQENSSYFVGTTVNDRVSQMLISMPTRNTLAMYPIIADTLEIPDNYWEIGTKIQWDQFKTEFISKFDLGVKK